MEQDNMNFVAALKELEGLSPEKTMAGLDAILEKLPDTEKAQFVLYSHQMDPRYHGFSGGHFLTRTLATVAPVACGFGWLALSVGAGGLSSLLARRGRGMGGAFASDPKDTDDDGSRYSAMVIEYAQWRLNAAEVTMSKASAVVAGLVNGLKHNGITATARLASSLTFWPFYSIAKGLDKMVSHSGKDGKADESFYYVPSAEDSLAKNNTENAPLLDDEKPPRNVYDRFANFIHGVDKKISGTAQMSCCYSRTRVEKILTRQMLKSRAVRQASQELPAP